MCHGYLSDLKSAEYALLHEGQPHRNVRQISYLGGGQFGAEISATPGAGVPGEQWQHLLLVRGQSLRVPVKGQVRNEELVLLQKASPQRLKGCPRTPTTAATAVGPEACLCHCCEQNPQPLPRPQNSLHMAIALSE